MNEKKVAEKRKYADYSTILRQDSLWQLGAIKLADKTTWTYLEPAAQISVKRERLRIQVTPFTRRHDTLQTLDNSKHLYFSKDNYPEAIRYETEYEVSMSARGVNTKAGEIYDGFVAFHLLDTDSGIAADFFAASDSVAMAYSRPKIIETTPPASKDRKYVAMFKELEVRTSAGKLHSYSIVYNPQHSRLSWKVDGETVAEEKNVPTKVKSFKLGLGVMTAKTITDGKSISNHGQGIIGLWSPIRVFESSN